MLILNLLIIFINHLSIDSFKKLYSFTRDRYIELFDLQ